MLPGGKSFRATVHETLGIFLEYTVKRDVGFADWQIPEFKVNVQYNGLFLHGIILLTQYYYHRGTRLNAIKRFLYLQPYNLT